MLPVGWFGLGGGILLLHILLDFLDGADDAFLGLFVDEDPGELDDSHHTHEEVDGGKAATGIASVYLSYSAENHTTGSGERTGKGKGG